MPAAREQIAKSAIVVELYLHFTMCYTLSLLDFGLEPSMVKSVRRLDIVTQEMNGNAITGWVKARSILPRKRHVTINSNLNRFRLGLAPKAHFLTSTGELMRMSLITSEPRVLRVCITLVFEPVCVDHYFNVYYSAVLCRLHHALGSGLEDQLTVFRPDGIVEHTRTNSPTQVILNPVLFPPWFFVRTNGYPNWLDFSHTLAM